VDGSCDTGAEDGAGTVVFLPGLLSSHRSWTHLVDDVVRTGRRLVAPDLFGTAPPCRRAASSAAADPLIMTIPVTDELRCATAVIDTDRDLPVTHRRQMTRTG